MTPTFSACSLHRSSIASALFLTACFATAPAAVAQKVDPDGYDFERVRQIMGPAPGTLPTSALPDITGLGHVLRAGNLYMKVTNFGHVGNYFLAISNDPAGQWPGGSGVEYLSTIRLAVAATDPTAPDPRAAHRVSYFLEWRPSSQDPVDRIYESFEGSPAGLRDVNDDNDRGAFGEQMVDEEFLNGKNDDGDPLIDEDFAARGQQMFSWEMRDDTPEAVNYTVNEKHVPLGLECRQSAWAYSSSGNTDFNVMEYRIRNVSGHRLDSLFVGFLVDLDAGPASEGSYFLDDKAVPQFPGGTTIIRLEDSDARAQAPPTNRDLFRQIPKIPPCPPSISDFAVHPDSALCPYDSVYVHGFSLVDQDGDQGLTPGAVTFMLLGHDIDPLGVQAPRRVGFRMVRLITPGQSFASGGNPVVDQQRYELMSSVEGVNPRTNHTTLSMPPGTGDYSYWCSVGPFVQVAPDQEIRLTTALMVTPARFSDVTQPDGWKPVVDAAVNLQRSFNGTYENRLVGEKPNTFYHGRETPLRAPPGQRYYLYDCVEKFQNPLSPGLLVTDDKDQFFNFDDNFCTGVWTPGAPKGWFRNRLRMPTPPPNPQVNVAADFNRPDNPAGDLMPAGDRSVLLAWDNRPEYTPDPLSDWFDVRGYKVWKAASWKRPRGSVGPGQDDWSLLADYRLFTARARHCATVYVPALRKDTTLCFNRGDLVDFEHGTVLSPDASLPCVGYPVCDSTIGHVLGSSTQTAVVRHYPVGRYRYTDTRVLDGFTYFYAVTAYDSTGALTNITQLEGKPMAVEADAVVPQAATSPLRRVWAVPNPYRGKASWDLLPSPTDPTGTHIDFLGMPAGPWTLRIFTVAGDLVAEIRSSDPVNAAVRRDRPNIQQDRPDDGQASWNLITRNGQDVASGIYLFTVSSSQGILRGRFVVIR